MEMRRIREGSSKQLVYYRAGDETRGLDLWKRRERRRLAYLLPWLECTSDFQEMPARVRPRISH